MRNSLMRTSTDQERFWGDSYADEYIRKNHSFDHEQGAAAWSIVLRQAERPITNFLECGCNIGRNLEQLSRVLPAARASVIEISKPAFDFVSSNYRLDFAFHGPILEAPLPEDTFDLVFTMGVLIHIRPEDLVDTMRAMIRASRRYVLIGEYFSRQPTMIEYQGEQDRLFKRDFGGYLLDHFPMRLVDYGFLWGRLYDTAGFDDITWWLFEKP